MGISRPECEACRLGRVSRTDACAFRKVRRRAGAYLIHQGSLSSGVWFLRAGTVSLFTANAAGQCDSSAFRGPGGAVPLSIPLREVAQTLGMRAETSSRALSALRKAGAVGRGYRVRVLDPSLLRKLAIAPES